MLKADPFAPQDAPDGVVLLEGDHDAAHGNVAEDDGQREGRQDEQQIQLPMLPHIDKRIVQTAAGPPFGWRFLFLHFIPPCPLPLFCVHGCFGIVHLHTYKRKFQLHSTMSHKTGQPGIGVNAQFCQIKQLTMPRFGEYYRRQKVHLHNYDNILFD